MSKVEFIDKSRKTKCWSCNGNGIEDISKITNITKVKSCKACRGSGKWKEDNFLLIATDNKGQKIAFSVDGLK